MIKGFLLIESLMQQFKQKISQPLITFFSSN